MNRLIYAAVAAAAASGIAAAPAFAGLSHNPSFSHKLPVRVPSGAQTVNVSDDHRLIAHESPAPSASPSRGREAEPGDDRGVRGGTVEPGDDNGNDTGAGKDVNDSDLNDDNGRHGSTVEPGDDSGNDAGRDTGNDTGHDTGQDSRVVVPSTVAAPVEPEPGDDKGGARIVSPSLAPQPLEAGDDGGRSGASSSGRHGGGHDK